MNVGRRQDGMWHAVSYGVEHGVSDDLRGQHTLRERRRSMVSIGFSKMYIHRYTLVRDAMPSSGMIAEGRKIATWRNGSRRKAFSV